MHVFELLFFFFFFFKIELCIKSKIMSSDENEQNEIDCNTCTATELSQLFDESLRISSEEAISLQQNYVLYLDNSRDFGKIAAGTSSKTVHIFDLNSSKGFSQLQKCDIGLSTDNQTICDIRFGKNSLNTLFVGVTNGKIYTYDLRAKPMPVQTFENTDAQQKPFMCFDVSANDSVLGVGSEQYEGEVNLILFDVRTTSTQAIYSESHRDDLTQIRFHPNNPDILASGSTDGLVNVFDISENDEDDALQSCYNTESSVQTINWHPKHDDYLLSCITHTNDFQLLDGDDTDVGFRCERQEITKLIKRKSAEDCYLINSHSTLNGDIFLLAGSNFNAGECLRSLTVHKKSLKPRNNFIDNKQIIRCSIFNQKDQVLVTAGEGGIVTVWENSPSSNNDIHKEKRKIKTKNSRKSKPY
ncbi:WD repeat-containing protein 89 [Sitodiplosis mosellana]|uniref:WD repeat-containing protein 89 n=1 Tax=Sitodiplosis mosellana TaxID=263140 RepID=UPI002443F698|nr:WD repeat-containing protein 89 [Sitodiplosis mosellana]